MGCTLMQQFLARNGKEHAGKSTSLFNFEILMEKGGKSSLVESQVVISPSRLNSGRIPER